MFSVHLRFMSSMTVALTGSVTLLFDARQVRMDMKSARTMLRMFSSLRTKPCGPVVKDESSNLDPWCQVTEGDGLPPSASQMSSTFDPSSYGPMTPSNFCPSTSMMSTSLGGTVSKHYVSESMDAIGQQHQLTGHVEGNQNVLSPWLAKVHSTPVLGRIRSEHRLYPEHWRPGVNVKFESFLEFARARRVHRSIKWNIASVHAVNGDARVATEPEHQRHLVLRPARYVAGNVDGVARDGGQFGHTCQTDNNNKTAKC